MPHAGSPPPPGRNQYPLGVSTGWETQHQPIRSVDSLLDDVNAIGTSPITGGTSRPGILESGSNSAYSWHSDEGQGSSDRSPEHRGSHAPCESIAGSKRCSRENLPDSAADEQGLWHCAICTKLAEDAVQTPCCGTLHCRACIVRWLATPSSRSQCAFCRAIVSASSLITDVRAERESAQAVRRCSFAEHGCEAQGNRKKMFDHERSCDFVPRSTLKRRIEELEDKESIMSREFDLLKAQSELSRSRLKLRDDEVEMLKTENRNLMKRTSEDCAELFRKSQEHLNYANALLNCCLRKNSGTEAMKVLHDLRHVHQCARDAIHERFFTVSSFFQTDVALKESNHNLSAVFTRRLGVTYCPTEDLTVTLLHPYHPKCGITIRLPLERWFTLRNDDSFVVENVMTSEEFHEFCVEGKFYLSRSGHGVSGLCCKRLCHCGVELSRRRHICREDAPTRRHDEMLNDCL